VDILAKSGVDISVSEGEQQGNYVALLGNLLFPLIAFAGLFLLFRRAGDGSGGGMGGPMDFGKSKSKILSFTASKYSCRASGKLYVQQVGGALINLLIFERAIKCLY
jgi:ATP-dependent Zn protease